jgi:ribosomal protein S18 acetylase RimI-like enzyme
MDEVRIRVATPGDIPFLRRMEWEALFASPQFIAAMGLDTLRQIEDRRWSDWPLPDEAAFVAEDAQQRLLGAVILRVHERDGERVVGYRLAMAVEEHMRDRGIGRRLIARAKRHSQEEGADYLLLLVDTSNERAIRAYRATGFELGDQYGVVPMIVRYK